MPFSHGTWGKREQAYSQLCSTEKSADILRELPALAPQVIHRLLAGTSQTPRICPSLYMMPPQKPARFPSIFTLLRSPKPQPRLRRASLPRKMRALPGSAFHFKPRPPSLWLPHCPSCRVMISRGMAVAAAPTLGDGCLLPPAGRSTSLWIPLLAPLFLPPPPCGF